MMAIIDPPIAEKNHHCGSSCPVLWLVGVKNGRIYVGARTSSGQSEILQKVSTSERAIVWQQCYGVVSSVGPIIVQSEQMLKSNETRTIRDPEPFFPPSSSRERFGRKR